MVRLVYRMSLFITENQPEHEKKLRLGTSLFYYRKNASISLSLIKISPHQCLYEVFIKCLLWRRAQVWARAHFFRYIFKNAYFIWFNICFSIENNEFILNKKKSSPSSPLRVLVSVDKYLGRARPQKSRAHFRRSRAHLPGTSPPWRRARAQ